MSRMIHMNKTMPAAVTGKKDLNTTGSSINIASKVTASSMQGTN
jgi:hypothetical protein